MYKCVGQGLGPLKAHQTAVIVIPLLFPLKCVGTSWEGGVRSNIFFYVFSYICSTVGFVLFCFLTVVWHSHLLQVGSLRFVFCVPCFLLCCWNPCAWAGPRLPLCVNYRLAPWRVLSPAGSTAPPAQTAKLPRHSSSWFLLCQFLK